MRPLLYLLLFITSAYSNFFNSLSESSSTQPAQYLSYGGCPSSGCVPPTIVPKSSGFWPNSDILTGLQIEQQSQNQVQVQNQNQNQNQNSNPNTIQRDSSGTIPSGNVVGNSGSTTQQPVIFIARAGSERYRYSENAASNGYPKPFGGGETQNLIQQNQGTIGNQNGNQQNPLQNQFGSFGNPFQQSQGQNPFGTIQNQNSNQQNQFQNQWANSNQNQNPSQFQQNPGENPFVVPLNQNSPQNQNANQLGSFGNQNPFQPNPLSNPYITSSPQIQNQGATFGFFTQNQNSNQNQIQDGFFSSSQNSGSNFNSNVPSNFGNANLIQDSGSPSSLPFGPNLVHSNTHFGPRPVQVGAPRQKPAFSEKDWNFQPGSQSVHFVGEGSQGGNNPNNSEVPITEEARQISAQIQAIRDNLSITRDESNYLISQLKASLPIELQNQLEMF